MTGHLQNTPKLKHMQTWKRRDSPQKVSFFGGKWPVFSFIFPFAHIKGTLLLSPKNHQKTKECQKRQRTSTFTQRSAPESFVVGFGSPGWWPPRHSSSTHPSLSRDLKPPATMPGDEARSFFTSSGFFSSFCFLLFFPRLQGGVCFLVQTTRGDFFLGKRISW